jgi:hypothetical protein
MEKEYVRKVLQLFADYTISMLENTRSEAMFNYYFEIGAMINAYAIIMADVYLD